jgi:flavin-dependent dehydrogenase
VYDVIVVGARCAGASTAMLLARRGYRVLLVDRATFPSDAISGHFILPEGTRKLAEWGLLNKVLASGCPPLNRWSLNLGDFTLSADVALEDGLPLFVGPRRTVLDKMLVDAAVSAGAEVREGFSVTGVVVEGGRVVGVQGHSKQVGSVVERARIVIGADGKHSKIAEAVRAQSYMETPSLTCWYYSYWRDLPCEGLEIHWRPGRVALMFPTHGELTLVAVGWPHEEFHSFRRDIEGNYVATLRLMPGLVERVEGARRAERIFAMADVPNFFRKPYGEGWALVGDAGHHKDPMQAHGMSDAFLDADLLARAVDDGFCGRVPVQEAMSEYERLRNERAIPQNEKNMKAARLMGWDPPEQLSLRTALRDNPEDTAALVRALFDLSPAEEFFAPDNIRRIMIGARRRQAVGVG